MSLDQDERYSLDVVLMDAHRGQLALGWIPVPVWTSRHAVRDIDGIRHHKLAPAKHEVSIRSDSTSLNERMGE